MYFSTRQISGWMDGEESGDKQAEKNWECYEIVRQV